jgi:hypothetical protein
MDINKILFLFASAVSALVVLEIHWHSLRLLPAMKMSAHYMMTTVETMAVVTMSIDHRLSATKH